MLPLKTFPCSPQQREQGWDEAVTWDDETRPASWEIHPNDNIYARGARWADVVPVYWDNGRVRGVDWWLQINENTTSLGSMLTQQPSSWRRFDPVEELRAITKEWNWSEEGLSRFEAQLAAMQTAQEQWSSQPSSGQLNVWAPQGQLVVDWQLPSVYAACRLDDANALVYFQMIQPQAAQVRTCSSSASKVKV